MEFYKKTNTNKRGIRNENSVSNMKNLLFNFIMYILMYSSKIAFGNHKNQSSLPS
jgi:hypothetical protein